MCCHPLSIPMASPALEHWKYNVYYVNDYDVMLYENTLSTMSKHKLQKNTLFLYVNRRLYVFDHNLHRFGDMVR